jgi:hypothetical protein
MGILIITFVVGYIAGWLSNSLAVLNRMLKNPDEMISALTEYKRETNTELQKKEDATLVREIEVENQNGVFYLFAKDNGQFLAQAPSFEEALKIVEQRFPNQSFQDVISSEGATRMGIKL